MDPAPLDREPVTDKGHGFISLSVSLPICYTSSWDTEMALTVLQSNEKAISRRKDGTEFFENTYGKIITVSAERGKGESKPSDGGVNIWVRL